MVSHLFYEKRHESALKEKKGGRGKERKSQSTLAEID
jgi:hypothetical protein